LLAVAAEQSLTMAPSSDVYVSLSQVYAEDGDYLQSAEGTRRMAENQVQKAHGYISV
jgi:hypothetical protein